MIILSIETSCDETAVSIVEATGEFPNAHYTVLGDALFSQIDIHREYGGVFPALAKREHIVTILPMLQKALAQANLTHPTSTALPSQKKEELQTLLLREPGLADSLISFFDTYGIPPIDVIAVTEGPGLEPALWVGINFAKALGSLWEIPVIGINHMEGHIFSSIFDGTKIEPIAFPAMALLISGGHTELVLMKNWSSYELVGKTRDDAVGEAFDKVARMLKLPYPGGPEISRRAELHRAKENGKIIPLPRPMIDTNDCDFSFSGLKTAVLYYLKNTVGEGEITEEIREEVSCAFEDAATEVLLKKSLRAVDLHGAQSLILGGGVSANKHIRTVFKNTIETDRTDVTLYLPDPKLTTDNSVMIALAAYAKYKPGETLEKKEIVAQGNLSVSAGARA
ncbi:tRNA (adenosine(37)-N6)-threonylcarbamoyltransferase complex transferase subunit TsaD [Patescibacteria group bacterium]|nr:tRNA (adenosine(37)-N6)-threonylcarbamoyltransferase complex transferase subunit TsaD [Patescibacteria group bacterium]